LLHAAKRKMTGADMDSFCSVEYQIGLQPLLGRTIDWSEEHSPIVLPDRLAFGALIGIGELVGCYATNAMTAEQRRRARGFGDFRHGRYAWEFKNIRRFDRPVPFKGAQGFFHAWYDPQSVKLIEVPPAPTADWYYCPKCLNNWSTGPRNFVGENCQQIGCDGQLICV
jgi:hypothetical protein